MEALAGLNDLRSLGMTGRFRVRERDLEYASHSCLQKDSEPRRHGGTEVERTQLLLNYLCFSTDQGSRIAISLLQTIESMVGRTIASESSLRLINHSIGTGRSRSAAIPSPRTSLPSRSRSLS